MKKLLVVAAILALFGSTHTAKAVSPADLIVTWGPTSGGTVVSGFGAAMGFAAGATFPLFVYLNTTGYDPYKAMGFKVVDRDYSCIGQGSHGGCQHY